MDASAKIQPDLHVERYFDEALHFEDAIKILRAAEKFYEEVSARTGVRPESRKAALRQIRKATSMAVQSVFDI